MITREELIRIGRFNKPHGVKGELSFTFTDDVFDRTECSYIVCEIDGIFVPFFIEEYRFKSDTTALIKLEDVDNEADASVLVVAVWLIKSTDEPVSTLSRATEVNVTPSGKAGFTSIRAIICPNCKLTAPSPGRAFSFLATNKSLCA